MRRTGIWRTSYSIVLYSKDRVFLVGLAASGSRGCLAWSGFAGNELGLSYFDGLSTPHSAANLIQAQRDYFGAHTYERVDWERGKFFHTNWTGEGGKTVSGTYNV